VPRGARFAVATAFFVNGAVQANWVTRIPAVQEELNLSAGALGAALLGLPVGLVAIVPVTDVWQRPGGAASIAFHVSHTGGALDRLFTYARGEALSEAQRAAARAEGQPGDPPAALVELVADAQATIERAFDQLRATSPESLLDERKVGRAGLPSNVLGLLFHAAEHCTRHVGQAITTAKILGGMRS